MAMEPVQVNDEQGNPLEELLVVGDTKQEALQRLSHYGPGGLVRKDKIGLCDSDCINADGAPYVFKPIRQLQQQQLLPLQTQISALQHSLQDVRASLEEHRVEGRREFQVLKSIIRRIFVQPVVRRTAAAANVPSGGAGAAVPATPSPTPRTAGAAVPAILSPTPRTLYLLWDEYMHGIGGRKAARLFSREDRGSVKHKYHRRKVVWDCIAALVRAGFTAEVAIDRVYQVYGEIKPVTRIINRMKQDRRAGIVHPSLQVYLISIRLIFVLLFTSLYDNYTSIVCVSLYGSFICGNLTRTCTYFLDGTDF
jgi:hypothetical protein